jgi:hypothetical protein
VTTLRAAIQYIYGLQNLLEEVQTGTLDLARYQLSEAELRPTTKPIAKPAKNAARPGSSTTAAGRKAAPRRKPANRQPVLLAASGGGVRCSPVTLAMKGATCGPVQKRTDKKAGGGATSGPKEAARYVLPLQPRDASHVLRRDYANSNVVSDNRRPPIAVQQISATQLQGSPPQMPPNLLNLRPVPVASLFPGGSAGNQTVLPPLQTIRGGAAATTAVELQQKADQLGEGRGSGSVAAAQQPFYCTTAGTVDTNNSAKNKYKAANQ